MTWLGTIPAICAASPVPLAIGGRAGAVKKFGPTWAFKMAAIADRRPLTSVTNLGGGAPLLSAMHWSLFNWLIGSGCPSATTWTGMPVVRIAEFVAARAARAPGGFDGNATAPRSPAGPLLVVPPEQGSALTESMPSVRKMIL